VSCYCGDKDCPQCNPEAKKRFWPEKEKKSPLEGLAEALKKMTPEEKEKWRNEALERAKKAREDEERKRNEPPKSKTGTCVVCRGKVEGEYVHGLRPGVDSRFVPIGPGGRQYYGWQFKGYHCTRCGLSYKFPPPDGIITGQGDAHETVGPSETDQGRDRTSPRRSRRGRKVSSEDV
jgi:hypothetical protein